MGYFFGLVRRGSPIQCVSGGEAGHIIFAPEPPTCIEGWGGPRVVAIGYWVGELWLSVTGKEVKSENSGLGSPIHLCVWGPAKGVRRVISFLHQNPLMYTTF